MIRKRLFSRLITGGFAASVLMLGACSVQTPTDQAVSEKNDQDTDTSDVEEAGTDENSSLNHLLPDYIQEAGVLKVGGPATIPPLMQLDDNGVRSGLVFDLINAVGEELEIEVEYEAIEYSALIPAIQAKRVDIGAGAFTDTVEREEQLDFVDYIGTQLVLMGQKDNPHHISTLADLCGLPVSTPHGTTSEAVFNAASKECVENDDDPIEVLQVASPAAAQLMVESERAVAFIQAHATAVYLDQNQPNLQIVGTPFRPEYHGLGVEKGNDELTEALRASFAAITESGKYLEILESYGLEVLALDEPIINGQTTSPRSEEDIK